MMQRPPVIADARIFVGRARSGRSQPLRVIADLPDGREVDVYLKTAGLRPDMTTCHLVSEWMGARYASAVCLPAAQPYQVRIGPEFLASFPPDLHDLRDTLAQGPDIAFGSQVIGRGYSMWTAAARPRPQLDLEMLQRIFAFDVLIENLDRSASPNLMHRDNHMVVFDHEAAFERCHLDFDSEYARKKPWEVHDLFICQRGTGEHIFAPYLRRKETGTQLDWRDTMQCFLLAPPCVLFQYAAEIPAEWSPATGRKIAEYLSEGMENLHMMTALIERGLVKR